MPLRPSMVMRVQHAQPSGWIAAVVSEVRLTSVVAIASPGSKLQEP